MRFFFFCATIFLSFFTNSIFAQVDSKPVVGVMKFTSENESKYAGSVSERIVKVVTNTRRFQVVDRTSYDKVKEELEFQKSEAFLDSKNTAKQDQALAAQYLIIGHILKMNIYVMKNSDGSINGYKASISFTLKVNNVESGSTTEASNFQTSVSPLMLSPESAVNEALNSIDDKINNYIITTFPLTTKIVKILSSDGDEAKTILILGGKSSGFKEGNKLILQKIEMIEGKPFPTDIGQAKITKVAGDDFSQCNVTKGNSEVLKSFNANEKIQCTLIIE